MSLNIERKLTNILADIKTISELSNKDVLQNSITERLSEILTQYEDKLDKVVLRLADADIIKVLRRL